MKFRYPCGGLDESLATLQDFDIEKIYENLGLDKHKVKLRIDYYGWDSRIQKDLWIVRYSELEGACDIIGSLKENFSDNYIIGFLQK